MDTSSIPPLLIKNLERVRQFQPLLARKLFEYLDEHGLSEFVQTQTAQGIWISGEGFPPFFQKDEQIVVRKQDKNNPLFCIWGTGVPPSLFSRLRKLPSNVLGAVVFEPNPGLLLHTLSLTSVFRAVPNGCRLAFIVYADDQLIDEAIGVSIRPMGLFVSANPVFFTHSGESETYRTQFEELSSLFRERIRISLQFLGNTAEDTLLGIRNMFLNAPWIWKTPSLTTLRESLEGRPVIWVASGPSLEKNIHLLKDVGTKAIIIAAESATKKLLRCGIRPHIAVALERPWTTYSNLLRPLLDEFPEECRRITLAAQSVLTSQALGCWPGPVIVFGKAELDLDKWLVGAVLGGNLVFSGASVAHMALSLASVFKASSVALVGQDLAYAEGFVSHASDTASKETMALEAERGRTDTFRVPGALGGEVETHFIWLVFLKIFESVIPRFNFPVYDCTEGGALIKGAEVKPLSNFIAENVDSLSEFEKMPEILFKEKTSAINGSMLQRSIERMEQAIDSMDLFLGLLDELSTAIERVSSPAISPEKRRELAYKASELLDDYHARNRSLAFIGQSYTFLAGTTIVKIRNLESVEEVVQWQKAFREIHAAHRKIVLFVKGYIQNAIVAARFYTLEKQHILPETCIGLSPLSRDDGMGAMDGLVSVLHEPNKQHPYTDEMLDVCMQNIIARSDPPHHKWDAEYQWKCALFLEQQGRNHLASVFMEGAARELLGKTIPVDLIVSFFKDSARIFLQNDFTHIPLTMAALNALTNAEEYAPEDEEIACLRKEILKARSNLLGNVLESGAYAASAKVSPWAKKELQANILLAEGRLAEALHLVWEILQETEPEVRVKLTPFLDWLLRTVEKCRNAADPSIRTAAEQILSELAGEFFTYSSLRVAWPAEILQELQRRGVKVTAVSADI